MKGLMVKSHADEMRDQPPREDGAAFSARLRHRDPGPQLAPAGQGLANPDMQWAWEIVPLKAGSRSLALDLDLSLKIPSSEEALHFQLAGMPCAGRAQCLLRAQNFLAAPLEGLTRGDCCARGGPVCLAARVITLLRVKGKT